MSDKTTNYGLTKPLGTDYYDIGIHNQNMNIIDANLKTLDNGKEALIKDAAVKSFLADADMVPLTDSDASSATKKITFANLKAVLKIYFDTLYNKYTHPTYTPKTAGLYKVTIDGTGHVSAAASVTKSDITALGIPTQDTVTEVVDSLTSTDTGKALSANQGKVLSNLVSNMNNKMLGFFGKMTIFNANGSITETNESGDVKTTVFNDNESITETFVFHGENLTKTTTFNEDGSITEVV